MEKVNYKEHIIEIVQDENPQNPRTEWDNATLMICFHKRYNLGDKHGFNHNDYNSWEEMEEAIEKELKPAIIKPLYLYDHSGITISTSNGYPFNDQWDAGQIGFVVFTKEQALKEYGGKRLTKTIIDKAEKLLETEVKTYDEYLRGEIFGYVVKDQVGEMVDSCYGYYGDPEESGLLGEARNIIDREAETEKA